MRGVGGSDGAVWLVAVSKVRRHVPQERLPLLGIAAALSFLGMMFNVPLPGGTTGHAVGGTLIAILFGPYAACLAVSVALLIQALFFGDGGILAFGANCFNMAFVLPFSGYAVYSLLRRHLASPSGRMWQLGSALMWESIWQRSQRPLSLASSHCSLRMQPGRPFIARIRSGSLCRP